jgi:hypothetical protein
MMPFYESRPVPGAIPVEQFEAGPIKNGKVQLKPVTAYERTDRVLVATGSDRNLTGASYTVQKVGTAWKIMHKSFWIH